MGDITILGASLPAGVEEHFIEAGGVKFRYLEGGAKGGAPILMLHGWPTWAEVWLPLAARLPADRRWIAIDLPNHGRSSILPGKGASLTSLRAAVAAFFDSMGLDRCTIIGCSIGGTLAVMLALDRPDRVERIVPIDAAGFPPKIPGKTVRMYLPFFIRAMLGAPGPKSVRKLLNKAVFFDKAFTTDEWVKAVTGAWAAKDRRKGLLAVGGALRKPDASVLPRLGEVSCPALVVWGKNDPQFDWHFGEDGAKKMKNARFVGIEGAGHFPMVEQPAATGAAITAFLQSA